MICLAVAIAWLWELLKAREIQRLEQDDDCTFLCGNIYYTLSRLNSDFYNGYNENVQGNVVGKHV